MSSRRSSTTRQNKIQNFTDTKIRMFLRDITPATRARKIFDYITVTYLIWEGEMMRSRSFIDLESILPHEYFYSRLLLALDEKYGNNTVMKNTIETQYRWFVETM